MSKSNYRRNKSKKGSSSRDDEEESKFESKKYDSKRKGKGRGPRREDSSKETERAHFFREPHDDYSKTNDISWWSKTTAVFDNATKVPFNRFMGDPVDFTEANITYTPTGNVTNLDVAGCMQIDFIPTIGTANSTHDAVNMAFDALYARIYREYTGAANFTKSELAFHVLHAMAISNYVGMAKRILRCLNSYAALNHNFPKTIYAALCDTDNLQNPVYNFNTDIDRLPQLRSRLNQIIYSFNSLFIPRFSDAFDRWYSLCSNVWMDEDIISASAYVFRAAGYYKFVEAHEDPDDPGTLIPSTLEWHMDANPISPRTKMDQYLDRAADLIAELRNSTNFSIVNAAIAKVYSGNGLYQLQLFMENELLEPKFDRNMMYQINNMDIISPDVTSLDVTENVTQNILMYEPKANTVGEYSWAHRKFKLLNSYDSNVTPEFLMESTRLAPHFRFGKSSGDPLLDVGTEIPLHIAIYYRTYIYDSSGVVAGTDIDRSGPFASNTFDLHLSTIDSGQWKIPGGSNISFDKFMKFLQLMSTFRNHPLIYVARSGWNYSGTNINPSNGFIKNIIGDLVTYTTITDSGLNGLNEAALLSCYYIM